MEYTATMDSGRAPAHTPPQPTCGPKVMGMLYSLHRGPFRQLPFTLPNTTLSVVKFLDIFQSEPIPNTRRLRTELTKIPRGQAPPREEGPFLGFRNLIKFPIGPGEGTAFGEGARELRACHAALSWVGAPLVATASMHHPSRLFPVLFEALGKNGGPWWQTFPGKHNTTLFCNLFKLLIWPEENLWRQRLLLSIVWWYAGLWQDCRYLMSLHQVARSQ